LDNGILLRLAPESDVDAGRDEATALSGLTPLQKDDAYRKLLFGVSFFHALVVERRKFGSLGYNIKYQFTQGDFETAVEILGLYMGLYDNIPWGALKYLIAQIVYGGRLIDDLDRRVLNCYIDNIFCNTAITTPGYKLAPPLEQYVIPPRSSLAEYRDYINGLPQTDSPLIFGQHGNADVFSRQVESYQLLSLTLSLQPADADTKAAEKGKAGKGKGKDADHEEEAEGEGGEEGERADKGSLSAQDERLIKLAQEIMHALPAPIVNLPPPITDINDQAAPLKAVLLQESERHMRLREIISTDLMQLQKGVRGLIMMSQHLDGVMRDLQNGRVPEAWGCIYKSTKSLAPWSRDFSKRVEQLQRWANAGSLKSFWLGGLSLPTGFMTAMQQQASRKMNKAIDELEWGFYVTRLLDPQRELDEKSVPGFGEGFIIQDCYLEGGNWDIDVGCLREPKLMELYFPMPCIRFKPQEARKKPLKFRQTFYECPVYYYPIRTGTREQPSFVVNIWLHSGLDKPEKWVKRGTAILLNLGD